MTDKTRSANPAAIAGVRLSADSCRRQKLYHATNSEVIAACRALLLWALVSLVNRRTCIRTDRLNRSADHDKITNRVGLHAGDPSGGNLSLTDNGRDFFSPTTSHSERLALLSFFASPGVYKELIRRFDGSKLPEPRILPNVVHRMGVPESWCARVAAAFVSTADEIGLIDGNGYLRYGAAVHKAGRPPIDHEESSTQEDLQPFTTAASALTPGVPSSSAVVEASLREFAGREPIGNLWSYSQAGGTIKVETPDPLSRALWDKLRRYVELLEPSDDQGEVE